MQQRGSLFRVTISHRFYNAHFHFFVSFSRFVFWILISCFFFHFSILVFCVRLLLINITHSFVFINYAKINRKPTAAFFAYNIIGCDKFLKLLWFMKLSLFSRMQTYLADFFFFLIISREFWTIFVISMIFGLLYHTQLKLIIVLQSVETFFVVNFHSFGQKTYFYFSFLPFACS